MRPKEERTRREGMDLEEEETREAMRKGNEGKDTGEEGREDEREKKETLKEK